MKKQLPSEWIDQQMHNRRDARVGQATEIEELRWLVNEIINYLDYAEEEKKQ